MYYYHNNIVYNYLYRVLNKLLSICLIFTSNFFRNNGKVLMIHSIGENKRSFNVSETLFVEMLQFLSSKKVIKLENMSYEENYYALSFDDVRSSVYIKGYPLLKKYQIPFTLFVNCSLLDNLGYITTEQLIELSNDPLCTIGSHGMTHTKYFDKDRRELEYELSESKRVLELITNKKVNLFAYPYGSFTAVGLRNIYLSLKYYDIGFSSISIPIKSINFLPKSFLPRVNVNDKKVIN